MPQALHTAVAVTLLCFVVAENHAQAGKPIAVGTKLKSAQTVSMDTIDHSIWDELLKKYVDKNGLVNYRAFKASDADMTSIVEYLNQLSTAGPDKLASNDAELAFWINAYNAVTVHGILREYPTTSIRNHTAKFFGYNIWHDLQLYVGGNLYSLDQIEHKILRKKDEPRIHFAIVCASIGCPRLLNEAYVAAKVNEQLEENAKDFFSRSQNFRYQHEQQKMQLSSIMDWFGEDFGANQAARLKEIAKWLPTEDAQRAAIRNSVTISYLDYDWKLNSQ